MVKDDEAFVVFRSKSEPKKSWSSVSSKEYTFDRRLFIYRLFSLVGTVGIFLMVIAALRVLYLVGLNAAAQHEANASPTPIP